MGDRFGVFRNFFWDSTLNFCLLLEIIHKAESVHRKSELARLALSFQNSV